jgi:hypothetical protein
MPRWNSFLIFPSQKKRNTSHAAVYTGKPIQRSRELRFSCLWRELQLLLFHVTEIFYLSARLRGETSQERWVSWQTLIDYHTVYRKRKLRTTTANPPKLHLFSLWWALPLISEQRRKCLFPTNTLHKTTRGKSNKLKTIQLPISLPLYPFNRCVLP